MLAALRLGHAFHPWANEEVDDRLARSLHRWDTRAIAEDRAGIDDAAAMRLAHDSNRWLITATP